MEKKREEKKLISVIEKSCDCAANDGNIPSDVEGSYTGKPLDGERPVQDADDL